MSSGFNLFGNTTQQPQQGSLFGSTTTTPANQQTTPNLFGNTATNTQQPATGSLFGNTQTQPATGGLFGNTATNTQTQPATGSLFGNTATNTQTQPAAGGLFGNTTQNQPATGNLFGNTATNTNAQPGATTGTSLFGNTNTSTTQPATGGLFGNLGASTTNQTAQPATGGNLFGNLGASTTNQSQPQTQPATGTLFGNTNNQSTTGTGGSLFGNTQTTGGGLFGNKVATPTTQPTTGFGGSLFGQQQQQQQPQQQTGNLFGSTTGGSTLFGQPKPQNSLGFPGQPTQPSATAGVPFTKSTKFNDLPDALKQTFEQIESHIQGRVQISQSLKQKQVGEEISKGQDLIRVVHKDLINCLHDLQSDTSSSRDLRAKVDQTVQDTIVAVQIVQGHQNQQAYGAYLRDHAEFPLEFFSRVTEEMQRRLQWYKVTMEQIERKLASTAQRAQYTPQAISSTLEAQHASIMALANKTAAVDENLQRLKAVYTQLWRQRTGSMRDPFNLLDRGTGDEFGLDGIYGK